MTLACPSVGNSLDDDDRLRSDGEVVRFLRSVVGADDLSETAGDRVSGRASRTIAEEVPRGDV